MRQVIISYRRALVVCVHLALWTAAFALAFLLRFELDVPREYVGVAWPMLVALLVLRSVAHWHAGLFHGLWRYAGLKDLIDIVKATTLSSVLLAVFIVFYRPESFPRTVFVIEWILAVMLTGGLRFGIRTLREIASQNAPPASGTRERILILGAGDAAEALVREMIRTHARRYDIVGLLDDSPAKQHQRIHGIAVLGPLARAREIAKDKQVDEVIIAIPSLSGVQMRAIVDDCRPTGAKILTLPAVDQLIDGSVTVNQLQEVRIEDLLRRDPVTLDVDGLERFIGGKVVLITGAGGSIGSELCHQICRFGPARVVLVEQAENNLFEVHRHLRAEYPELNIVPCVADICDSRRLEAIFERERPAVVFHAAAHKHVPMMEYNPGEAIKNNVFGTKKVADMSDRFGAEAFVMVSTDKAVNPTSIMGASKRAAEVYVQALSQRSDTRYVTVRFGNVLGSAGSVVPIFREQIARGGPVSVTHPEVKRYFMTIPEACQLVLQAGSMGAGGEIFVLDMGEPVKIVDLARDLIRLSGLVPDTDIAIEFTGLRPGEKLFEELSCDAEHAEKTRHPKIFVGKFRPVTWRDVNAGFDTLKACTDATDRQPVVAALQGLVPEFAPSIPPPAVAPAEPARAEATPAPRVSIAPSASPA
jgi:FlaA1/EpsC-like NDP-sugar epimerase